MVDVKYKKLNETAKEPFKKYDEDFCYDLVATEVKEIAPNIYEYKLGLATSIDKDSVLNSVPKILRRYCPDFRVSLDFRPRSSVWETGMVLANCIGTVDQLYRGEIKAIFYQVILGHEIYKVGDRVIQCKLGLTLPINWIEVNELDETTRGSGGFGSTGK